MSQNDWGCDGHNCEHRQPRSDPASAASETGLHDGDDALHIRSFSHTLFTNLPVIATCSDSGRMTLYGSCLSARIPTGLRKKDTSSSVNAPSPHAAPLRCQSLNKKWVPHIYGRAFAAGDVGYQAAHRLKHPPTPLPCNRSEEHTSELQSLRH